MTDSIVIAAIAVALCAFAALCGYTEGVDLERGLDVQEQSE